MATFKYEIFKDRKRIDGTYNVKIRVTHNRKLKRIPTSIYVTKEDITKGFKIKNQSILDELNNIISIYREQVQPVVIAHKRYGYNRTCGAYNQN